MEGITTKIPASPKIFSRTKRTKVAAYCRVSVGTDETLHSLTAQISHYTKLIKSRHDWEYVGVYADFAETGTKSARPEFQRLLADCRVGKIGYVLTKSISRFARNTVTLLETVRELKTLGISVYFEEQGINSMSADGELMLTLLASVAQEESLATSENIKWRKRHDMERGLTVPKKVYGYDVQGNQLVINSQQAQIVEVIFADYLQGKSCTQIANFFNSCGLPSPHGKKWLRHTIRSILMNEKMCGNILHQKTFVTDHITKKQKPNTGELPKYFIEDAHQGIISGTLFERVQAELAVRGMCGKETSGSNA